MAVSSGEGGGKYAIMFIKKFFYLEMFLNYFSAAKSLQTILDGKSRLWNINQLAVKVYYFSVISFILKNMVVYFHSANGRLMIACK